jgi:hypothetical protein
MKIFSALFVAFMVAIACAAPPIITIMKALIEVGPPMPTLTPMIETRRPPTRPASMAPSAKPMVD